MVLTFSSEPSNKDWSGETLLLFQLMLALVAYLVSRVDKVSKNLIYRKWLHCVEALVNLERDKTNNWTLAFSEDSDQTGHLMPSLFRVFRSTQYLNFLKKPSVESYRTVHMSRHLRASAGCSRFVKFIITFSRTNPNVVISK